MTPLMNRPLDMPSSPAAKRFVDDWSALLPTVDRQSDLQDTAEFTRRWSGLCVSLAVGVFVAVALLATCWLFTPAAMGAIPVWSVVLLVFLLDELGEGIVFGYYQQAAFITHEARYDHRLFWPSPVDSPQVKSALMDGTRHGFITGIWITLYLALAVWLVSWDSPWCYPSLWGSS